MIKNIKLKHLMYDELILCYGLKDYKKMLGKYNLECKIGPVTTGQCTSFYYEVDGYRKLIIGLKKKDDIDKKNSEAILKEALKSLATL